MGLDDVYRLTALIHNLPQDVGFHISKLMDHPLQAGRSWSHVIVARVGGGKGEASDENMYVAFLRAYAACLDGSAEEIRKRLDA